MASGTAIAPEVHDLASSRGISPYDLQTLHDLLCAFRKRWPRDQHLASMLQSTAEHISICLDKPVDQIQIAELGKLTPRFKVYLVARRFKRNSVRSYINYLRVLLRKAEQLGWKQQLPDVAPRWREIRRSVLRRGGAAGIVKYAIREAIPPQEFGETALDEWGKEMLARGRTSTYVTAVKNFFRKRIFDQGFSNLLPDLSAPSPGPYGVSLDELPEPLRSQVVELFRWKVAKFSEGRPTKSRHRPVTARNLQGFICRIFGYLLHFKGVRASTLEVLISKEHLTCFAEWLLNERNSRSQSLSINFGILYAALRHYPPLKDKGFSWIPELIAQLPADPDLSRIGRANNKWADYDKLWEIPGAIRRVADTGTKVDPIFRALMVRDGLLVLWLLVLPWRQRNLRECKLGPQTMGGNLFKGAIADYPTIARSRWVEDALKDNPNNEFWQFYFRPEETKTGNPVHSLLPRQLIFPLEEYLTLHRPLLIKGNDPGCLFLNEIGKPMSSGTLRELVRNITCRFLGTRINPHLFRHILAHKWLEDHPEDYLTLSKILWHNSIKTTLQTYGRSFDESHGARRMEEWLDQRTKK